MGPTQDTDATKTPQITDPVPPKPRDTPPPQPKDQPGAQGGDPLEDLGDKLPPAVN